jgi:hypothetical protein
MSLANQPADAVHTQLAIRPLRDYLVDGVESAVDPCHGSVRTRRCELEGGQAMKLKKPGSRGRFE